MGKTKVQISNSAWKSSKTKKKCPSTVNQQKQDNSVKQGRMDTEVGLREDSRHREQDEKRKEIKGKKDSRKYVGL